MSVSNSSWQKCVVIMGRQAGRLTYPPDPGSDICHPAGQMRVHQASWNYGKLGSNWLPFTRGEMESVPRLNILGPVAWARMVSIVGVSRSLIIICVLLPSVCGLQPAGC